MSRLTVTLSEARYRSPKEAPAQREKTIAQLIAASLDFHGIKLREDARAQLRRVRARSRPTSSRPAAGLTASAAQHR